MMKPLTLRSNLRQMTPAYREFWNALFAWQEEYPEGYDKDEFATFLDSLARRKDFSLADWHLLTTIRDKALIENSASAKQALTLLLPALDKLR